MGCLIWLNNVVFFIGSLLLAHLANREASRRRSRNREADAAARADQQTAWLAEGDPRGIYGEYMPPAMFLPSERVDVKPSNDGTPLLTRAAAMLRRLDYLDHVYGGYGNTKGQDAIEVLAINDFMIRMADLEHMSWAEFVIYVRSSRNYAAAGDGSRPLTNISVRQACSASATDFPR